MGKEDYVSLEVAKLLKEKGFDKECEYYISANTSQVFNKGRLKLFKEEGHEVFLCPTLYEAQKWLRNKKIYISALPTRDNGVTVWYYAVVNEILKKRIEEGMVDYADDLKITCKM